MCVYVPLPHQAAQKQIAQHNHMIMSQKPWQLRDSRDDTAGHAFHNYQMHSYMSPGVDLWLGASLVESDAAFGEALMCIVLKLKIVDAAELFVEIGVVVFV